MEKIATAITALLIGFIALLIVLPLSTWFTMLGLGILGEYFPALAGFSFWDSFFIAIGLSLLGLKSADTTTTSK